MTKTKNTKKALLISVLSLVVCLSMLIGTTYAWFTDTVTSGVNTIMAGNLDIELYHTNKVDTDEKVNANTKLFDDIALWEPGAVVYENFKVENKGSLALKYVLSFVAENATEVNGVSIVDALKIAVVEGGFSGNNRDAAKALTNYVDFESFNLSDKLINKNDAKVYGIVIYWEPTANDNIFNMNNGATTALTVDLGVKLVATQLMSEEDSFGFTYDEDAKYPTVTIATATEDGEEVELSTSSLKVTVPGGATEAGDVYEIVVSNEDKVADAQTGEVTVDFDLTLYKNNVKVSGDTVYAVEIPVGNVFLTNVTHNGIALTEASTGADQTYKFANGVLTIYTKSFSPFSVSYLDGELIASKEGEKPYALSFDELRASVNAGNDFSGWTITLLNDIDFNGAEFAPIGIATGAGLSIEGCAPFSGMFDGNGHTLSNYKITDGITVDGDPWLSLFALIYAKNGNTAGVKNLNIKNAVYDNVNGTVGMIANLANSDGASALEFSNLDINGTVNAFGYYGEAGLVTLFYGNEGLVSNVDIDVDFIIPVDFTVSGYKFISPCMGQLSMLENGHITFENVNYSECGFYCPAEFKLEDRSTVVAGYNAIWVYNTLAGTRVLGCGYYAGQFYDRGITVTIDGVDYTHADLMKGQKDVPGYMYDYIIRPDSFTAYTPVKTAAELKAALKDDAVIMITEDISDTSIKLPSVLKNVTIKSDGSASLKNVTVTSADGNSVSYDGLTFDGITFDNSNIVLTGMRSGAVLYKDLTIKNCVFKNLVRTGNYAIVHMNMAAKEAVRNFTFTNNVVDGVSGSSNNALTLKYVTGNITIEGNEIKNVALYPFNLMIANNDGIEDNVSIKNNVFAGSANGRLQGVGESAAGTDTVNIKANNNIITGITNTYQICFWQFNAEKTTADFSKNYFDVDLEADPSMIYFNSQATSVEDLVNMGVYPFYLV